MHREVFAHVAALAWLVAAFLAACGILVAGYAPYSDSMGDVLQVAGAVLLGAAALGGLGALLRRFAKRERGRAPRS